MVKAKERELFQAVSSSPPVDKGVVLQRQQEDRQFMCLEEI